MKQSVYIDRTVDELVWPPWSESTQRTTTIAPHQSSSAKVAAGFHELKSMASTSELKEAADTASEKDDELGDNESENSKRSSFDLSVLIGDAHSLIRFSVFNRIVSESTGEDLANLPLSESSSDSEDEHSEVDKTKMDPGKSREGEKEWEDVEVKTKLLPKRSNVHGHQQETSVTMEYTDTD